MKLQRTVTRVFLLAVLALSTMPAFAVCPASLGMVIDPNGNELMHWTGRVKTLPNPNESGFINWYLFEGQVYDGSGHEVTHQLWIACK